MRYRKVQIENIYAEILAENRKELYNAAIPDLILKLTHTHACE